MIAKILHLFSIHAWVEYQYQSRTHRVCKICNRRQSFHDYFNYWEDL